MTDQVDAEAIAAGLSEAQKRALVEAIERGKEYRVPGFELRNVRCLAKLENAGLVRGPVWNRGSRLTPRGLAVRDVLMKEKG